MSRTYSILHLLDRTQMSWPLSQRNLYSCSTVGGAQVDDGIEAKERTSQAVEARLWKEPAEAGVLFREFHQPDFVILIQQSVDSII